MFKETHIRSILKTLSYRFWMSSTTVVLVYIVTGAFKIALTVGGLEVIAKIILYFIHERSWDKIRFGKKEIPSFVLWFTGLPASGKTTLADAVSERLSKNGFKVEQLDGDKIRNVFPKTGFSREERNTHITRAGFLASILEKNGVIVVASFVSPYQEARDFVRHLCQNFIEVFVATSLEVCERRDTKGLYKKARKGKIAHFTGIDDPYEVPTSPEMVVDTANESVEKCTYKIMGYLKEAKFL